MSGIDVDAALGDVWDEIGDLIEESGEDDSSGYRRWIAALLSDGDFAKVSQMLRISPAKCQQLANELK